jgi:hypothetical protein
MKILLPTLLLFFVSASQEAQVDSAPIRGQVVDEEGAPVAGARHWVSGFEERVDGEWRLVFFTGETLVSTTDAEGRFELPTRPGLRYDLDFDIHGKAPAFYTQVEAGAQLKVVVHEGLDVAGRVVLENGDGIAGFEVGLERPNGRGVWFRTRARTDEDGRFEFPAFREGGEWQVTVGRATLPLEAKQGEVVDDLLVEIRLSRTGR